MRRLHIGGWEIRNGWEIFDAIPRHGVDHLGLCKDLSRFPDGTFQEIYASHVIEHLDYVGEISEALREWLRVLVPGGTLYVSAPDLDTLAELILLKGSIDRRERFEVMRMMFGGHNDSYDYHVAGLNEDFLGDFLLDAGFGGIRRVTSFDLFEDSSSLLFKGIAISVNLIARKPQ